MPLSLHFENIGLVGLEKIKREYAPKLKEIFEKLQLRDAVGVEMTGWIPWIFENHSELFESVKKIKTEWIEGNVQVVVVIGTGGSYLGTKACLEFVKLSDSEKNFEFYFLPYFSPREVESAVNYLKDKKFAIVVISKSGGTLESAVSFRILRALLFDKEKEEHYRYIISITTIGEGVLYELSKKHNYHIFGIPKNIGGRYSALTPVGLVPAILHGLSPEDLIEGARECHKNCYHLDFVFNAPFQYAAYRHFFAESEKLSSECLISYEPKLSGVLHAVKQLFAESEGKNEKGLMPVILDFSPDLHSVGQLLQEGKTSFFETIMWVEGDQEKGLRVEKNIFGNEDQLDWLSGSSLYELNYSAFAGTLKAHTELKKIQALVINIKDWSVHTFGYIYFFFSLSAMFSAYLFEQNPFDQPGVEAYKERMKTILREQLSGKDTKINS